MYEVFKTAEAATGGFFKKVFLKISQYSQENVCVGASGVFGVNFIKLRLQHRYFPVNIKERLRVTAS